MVNKRHKNCFLAVKIIVQFYIYIYIYFLATKRPTQIILNFFVLLHQIIIFVHVVFVLVGIVIFFSRNQLICNECLLFIRF